MQSFDVDGSTRSRWWRREGCVRVARHPWPVRLRGAAGYRARAVPPSPRATAHGDAGEAFLEIDATPVQVWEDGVLTADELQDVMTRVVVPLKSASVDAQQKACHTL